MTLARFSLRVCAAHHAIADQCSLLAAGGGGGGVLRTGAQVAILPQYCGGSLRCNSTWTPMRSRGFGLASGSPLAAATLESQFIRNMTARTMSSKSPKRPTVIANEITKSLQIISDQKVNVEHDPKTLKLKQPLSGKPLVVMLCWLQARQKHVEKYAKLYVDQGLDVLAVQITPWQLLWPVKGTQLVARDVIQFLHANTADTQLFLHGLSVGGYMWGECLVHVERDSKYQSIVDRCVGQVWDSAADVTEIHIGIPKAVFPRNPTMQTALRKYMIYHMKTFHEPATSHYIRSSQMFHGNLVRTPALFLVSKRDPVGPPSSNDRVRDNWVRNKCEVTYKIFEKSPHVGHFQMYPEEYTSLLLNHLRLVNLIQQDTERLRAKL